jgi:hypothetical protein
MQGKVMAELRGLLTSGATDATVIEADADSLLAELSVKFNAAPEGNAEPTDADPPTGHPPDDAAGVPRP